MAKKYILECEAGVAGDMLVAALLDLGGDEKKLLDALKSLPVDGYEIKISRVKKAGIDAMDFDVVLDEEHQNHDHDMEYLHGGEHHHEHHGHGHDHHHGDSHHGQDHHHGDSHHGHEHHGHGEHVHRHLSDIYQIFDASSLSKKAKALAKRMFEIVAESEAKAHAMPVEEVHFHEVGAVDSIVDIASIAILLDDLGIDELIVPYLCEGRGTVRCAHGILPIPVPAVANITEAYSIPLRRLDASGEFVTPTGACAVAALRSKEKLPFEYVVKRTGIGAGKRNYERASILRLMEIETKEDEKTSGDMVWRLETDIDDCSGERLGFVMKRLFELGAREAHFTPIQMKKNRPGTELVVVCDEDKRAALEELIFKETTTIGIRRMRMERTVLERKPAWLDTAYGRVEAKSVTLPGGECRVYPEYDSVEDMALKNGISFFEAWQEAENAINSYINS